LNKKLSTVKKEDFDLTISSPIYLRSFRICTPARWLPLWLTTRCTWVRNQTNDLHTAT